MGPSAIGSEKGMPSSIISAPLFSNSNIKAFVVCGSGSPAVMKGIKAGFFLLFKSRNFLSILFIKTHHRIIKECIHSKIIKNQTFAITKSCSQVFWQPQKNPYHHYP